MLDIIQQYANFHAALTKEKQEVEQRLTLIDQALSGKAKAPKKAAKKKTAKKKRKVSAATKQKMAAAAKKRWADKKKPAKKKSKA